ncbi:MAG: response regulator transcription factor [Bacteroidia bacterium]|nr:response regulator transcription factor [Bacteroidia bacterium]
MQTNNDLIKVIVAEDHELVRQGFVALLEKLDFVQLIGEASNGRQVIDLLRSGKLADVVLMDIEMPVMNGIEAAEMIANNFLTVKTIMLTMLNDKDVIQQAIDKGAKGFLFKNSPAHEFGEAIKRVASGENYFSSEVAAVILNRKVAAHANREVDQLSERELEIIRLVAEGFSSNEIGKKLFISPRTVDTHRNNILQKLDLPNIASLVSFAYKNKLIK